MQAQTVYRGKTPLILKLGAYNDTVCLTPRPAALPSDKEHRLLYTERQGGGGQDRTEKWEDEISHTCTYKFLCCKQNKYHIYY